MKELINNLNKYLKESLCLTLTTRRWEHEKNLPILIREKYSFYVSELLKNELLLMLTTFEAELTPAAINKHMKMVNEAFNGEVILILKDISSYNRKRLIEHKVPFVVPGNQMYLPMFGIDLREHFRKNRKHTVKISPATQVAILYVLNKKKYGPHTPSSLAKELKYSIMTMTRVFDEIESIEIGKIAVEGRERILRFNIKGKALWEKAREFMTSPVKKRIYVKSDIKLLCKYPVAGLTGLAKYSMISEPAIPVYALSFEELKTLKIIEIPIADDGTAVIEIWKFPPSFFAENKVTDKFSLYMSFSGDIDTRVEMALEEMMEKIKW